MASVGLLNSTGIQWFKNYFPSVFSGITTVASLKLSTSETYAIVAFRGDGYPILTKVSTNNGNILLS